MCFGRTVFLINQERIRLLAVGSDVPLLISPELMHKVDNDSRAAVCLGVGYHASLLGEGLLAGVFGRSYEGVC